MIGRDLRGTAAALMVAVAAAVPGLPARAQLQPDEWKPTMVEILQLPQFCQGVMHKDLAMPGNPIVTCGEWFNHFCPGLVALDRAAQVTRPMQERRYFLSNAAGHLAYTRKNLSPKCVLADHLAAAETRARILKITVK